MKVSAALREMRESAPAELDGRLVRLEDQLGAVWRPISLGVFASRGELQEIGEVRSDMGLQNLLHRVRLEAELHAAVDGTLSTIESHTIAQELEHSLLHALPQLETVTVHVDPIGAADEDYHATTAHHRPAPPAQPPMAWYPVGRLGRGRGPVMRQKFRLGRNFEPGT